MKLIQKIHAFQQLKKTHVSPVSLKCDLNKVDGFSSWCSEMSSASFSEKPGACRQHIQPLAPCFRTLARAYLRRCYSQRYQPQSLTADGLVKRLWSLGDSFVAKNYKIHSQKSQAKKQSKATHFVPQNHWPWPWFLRTFQFDLPKTSHIRRCKGPPISPTVNPLSQGP